jgi:hypothetical protein
MTAPFLHPKPEKHLSISAIRTAIIILVVGAAFAAGRYFEPPPPPKVQIINPRFDGTLIRWLEWKGKKIRLPLTFDTQMVCLQGECLTTGVYYKP